MCRKNIPKICRLCINQHQPIVCCLGIHVSLVHTMKFDYDILRAINVRKKVKLRIGEIQSGDAHVSYCKNKEHNKTGTFKK